MNTQKIQWILIAILVVAVILSIAKNSKSKKTKHTKIEDEPQPQPQPKSTEMYSPTKKEVISCHIPDFYSLKKSLMNSEEEAIYYFCLKAITELPNCKYLYVFPQVRVADFIFTKDYNYIKKEIRSNQRTALNQIMCLSVDFLICRKIKNGETTSNYVPVAVLEYDGGGHDTTNEGKARDAFKDELFCKLNLDIERIKPCDKNAEYISTLIDKINKKSFQSFQNSHQ